MSNSRETNESIVYHGNDSWEEVTIEVPWGTVQGKWWGSRNKQPILALHGWRDNCGSFDRLCPLMPAEIPILCIDLPGHGKSSHLPKGMNYYAWDGVALIRRIVRKFDWKNVTLMGHSFGGGLTFLYAATFPAEVAKLINIDIAGPTHPEYNPDETGSCIDKLLHFETLPDADVSCLSYEDVMQLFLEAYRGSLDMPSLKTMMKRNMEATPAHLNKNGFIFMCDPRLKESKLGLFIKQQVLDYGERIRCEVLNIRADSGLNCVIPHYYDDIMETLRKSVKLLIYKRVPGTHHVHLVAPELVTPHINKFLLGP